MHFFLTFLGAVMWVAGGFVLWREANAAEPTYELTGGAVVLVALGAAVFADGLS
jgi:hypothetical protein